MSVLSSKMYQDIFSTEEMRTIFSDKNQLQKWIDAEIALAEAEAEVGVIPQEAAAEIRRKGNAELFSMDDICAGIKFTWHPLLPMIRQYEKLCQSPWGEYIHWGATTQDIMDTGLMLQIREAMNAIERDLKTLVQSTKDIAVKYADTVMPGRTHGQQGLPLTFGYKASVWASEMGRHLERLTEIRRRTNTGNLSGGVGTLASLGEHAAEVREKFFANLNMDTPDVTWHAARDRIAEIVHLLSLIGTTCGKVANEIAQLQRTEIGELEEPFYMGKVGSSTMPQKRNPMASETVVAISAILRQYTSLITQSMMMENERDMRVWMIEWDIVPSAFLFTSGALKHMEWVLNGLQVRSDRMRHNLSVTKGLIMAEAVLMKLSEKLGHQKAHDIVYEIAMNSFENQSEFGEELRKNKDIINELKDAEIDGLLNTDSYIGLSKYFVRKVVDTD